MIVAAFYKLLSILVSDYDRVNSYEANLQAQFVDALKKELEFHDYGDPANDIVIEKPYFENRNIRADICFKMDLNSADPLKSYGCKNDNWIEVKYFSGISRNKEGEAKTRNVGQIINDISRLCLFPKQTKNKKCQNGRYLLLVFDRDPKEYLAFKDKNKKDREWLKNLLNYHITGQKDIEIDLSQESKTIKAEVLHGANISTLNFKCMVHSFYPLKEVGSNVRYYGFLIYVWKYKIIIDNQEINVDSLSDQIWTQAKIDKFKKMIKSIEKKAKLKNDVET
jgi:hypothetical protein